MEDSTWGRLQEADWLFRKMIRRYVKERDRVTVAGITLPGMLILHKIINEGEQRLGDLAEEFDFTSGAITALSDKLEKAGYTVRKRKEDDRRTVLLDVTDKGRELYDRNDNIGARCITLLFEGFTEEEIALQSRFYERMVSNLEKFSETLLTLGKQNAEVTEPPTPEQKRSSTPKKSNYLSY
ncbi:MarR family winged helix-turn-helix transcriptional regulator [Paenibacillus crassostreae]|uniref:Transcriptional regulator n=1 Tax=Paenibacillus crassostreae TaxID=1763538 RepID=A0A167B5Z2_9BACL|nr:MarR family transcriptional regulator [Paenibacillus crassostreae]AOZ93140.1 MarR family transcriptional regulator [Paenibacillus crassostreae]OAB71771.1 transcriptional regulator [Paenibacillus crassostreae]